MERRKRWPATIMVHRRGGRPAGRRNRVSQDGDLSLRSGAAVADLDGTQPIFRQSIDRESSRSTSTTDVRMCRRPASCGLVDLLRSGLLHRPHVEIEHALALVALFLVLLPKLDNLFEDLDVESFAFGFRKHFLFLLAQLEHLVPEIFHPFTQRANVF